MYDFDLGKVQVHKGNHLPHWQTEHGVTFVTWHLADALPVEVRAAFKAEQEYEIERLQRTRGQLTIADRVRLEGEMRRKLQRALDRGYGECVLRSPQCAEIVAASIVYFDTVRYELYTWSVMPSHVHVVFSECEGCHTADIVKAWKGFTSKEVNKALGRSGTLWQEDYFDRAVRNERHFRRAVDYVLNNPASAGLRNWKYAAVYPERIAKLV